jgi:hypothetical protein
VRGGEDDIGSIMYFSYKDKMRWATRFYWKGGLRIMLRGAALSGEFDLGLHD